MVVVGDMNREVERLLARLPYPRLQIAYYAWAEVEAMRDYGSLYLHHLATEGRRIVADGDEDRFRSILADLPPFARAQSDLDGFRRVFVECCHSMSAGGWPDFECEVIASVVRHAAILGAYCMGSPAFGREQPFKVVANRLGYAREEVRALVLPASAWRLKQPGDHTQSDAVDTWIACVEQFLTELEEVVNDYSRVLSAAA